MRVKAERIYHKYTEIGAKVEFKFDKEGQVEMIEIKKDGWHFTITEDQTIIHTRTLEIAESVINQFLFSWDYGKEG